MMMKMKVVMFCIDDDVCVDGRYGGDYNNDNSSIFEIHKSLVICIMDNIS